MSPELTASDTNDEHRRAGLQRQSTGYEARLLGHDLVRFI